MNPFADKRSNRYFAAGRVIASSLVKLASVVFASFTISLSMIRSFLSNLNDSTGYDLVKIDFKVSTIRQWNRMEGEVSVAIADGPDDPQPIARYLQSFSS